MFDSVSGERRPNAGIAIQNGKIAKVDANVTQPVLSTAKVIDLAETDTILSGFAYHRELLVMTYAGIPPVAAFGRGEDRPGRPG